MRYNNASHGISLTAILYGGFTIRNQSLKITFIEPYATDDGTLFSPESKDVYTFYRTPARGIDLLATLCRQAGYHDTRAFTLKYCWGDRNRTEKLWSRLAESDVVGISTISRTAPPAYALAGEVRAINPLAWIVFGGTSPSTPLGAMGVQVLPSSSEYD